jgi:hypothetical protein
MFEYSWIGNIPVEPVSKPLVLLDVHVKLVHVWHVKIVIPLIFSNNIYQRHFPNLKWKKWKLTKQLLKSEFKTFTLQVGLY